MQLIKITRFSALLAFAIFPFLRLNAQENAPFSRYGLGDIYPSQNIATRGMGGTAVTYFHDQAINSVNPASYSSMRYVKLYGGSKGALISYDIGISIDARTLRSNDPANSYHSTNFIPSYIHLGIPLSAKADARKRNVGLVFGLKPATRINYSVQNIERTSIDSMRTLYEGKGGMNQVFAGIGKKIGNLSIGFNGGYEWGRKQIGTKINFLNDSVGYYSSNSAEKTDYWGLYLMPGISYNMKLSEITRKNYSYSEAVFLRLAGSGTFSHNLKATSDTLRETYADDATIGIRPIDTIYYVNRIEGNISIPVTYNVGIQLSKKYIVGKEAVASKWSVAAEYSAGKWSDYRFYGKADDHLIDSWMFRVGGEIIPTVTSTRLWNRATYRLGYYTGVDYINADGNKYKVHAFTLGFGFNIKKWTSYDNQSTFVNTAIEFGKRGSDVNNITENFFKFSVGFSLSDLWFTRRKYE